MKTVHDCEVADLKTLAERVNPIDSGWPSWVVTICKKCGRYVELQAHSDEGVRGEVLEIRAFPKKDYVKAVYGLTELDIQRIRKSSNPNLLPEKPK